MKGSRIPPLRWNVLGEKLQVIIILGKLANKA